MLRILLLSDIHFIAMADEMDDYYDERTLFLQDLKDCHKAKGDFDHVFVCGDIAWHGKKDEYDKALTFFNQISSIINCPIEQFYVVPGNHDKDWSLESKLSDIMHSGLSNVSSNNQELFNNLLNEDFEALKSLYKPFKAYNEFAVGMNCIEPFMDKCLLEDSNEKYECETDKLYMRSFLHDIGNYKVCLYGFNTAIISDGKEINDDNKGHKLFLPRLSYHAPVDSECINICMMHHPLDRIVGGEEIAQYLDDKFPIQIYGHLHKADIKNDTSLHIMSGAFQPPEDDSNTQSEYLPAYHILEMSVLQDKESRDISLQVTVYVEQYNGGGFEHRREKEESETYKIKLPKEIKRWSDEQMETKNKDLPKGISIRKIQYEFIQSPKAARIMKDFHSFDANKTLSQNIIPFLIMISKENRYEELWEKVQKYK